VLISVKVFRLCLIHSVFCKAMKKKVNLVISLMICCTLLVLGLQLYWNYAAYQSNTRVFKSDINGALEKAVIRLMNIRRDEFALQYKKWLNDTSLVTITCKFNDERSKSTIFHLKDTHPPYKGRLPFSVGFQQFKPQLDQITPSAKQYFIEHFVGHSIRDDLKSGSAYYYTQRLGELMVKSFKKDKLDVQQLKKLYKEELSKVGIDNEFQFKFDRDKVQSFSTPNEGLAGRPFSTRQFVYGFHSPMITIHAYFPNPNLVFLQKMKWVLVGSLFLIGVTLFCFAYTVRTMWSQHKLAELKDNFVNNMTHELKTPVATISIAAEAIQDFELTRASADEYLGIIRYQAGALTSLIDQILKSMVNEQAKIIIKREKVNIGEVLTHCIRQYQPQVTLAKACLTTEINVTEFIIIGDRIHIGNVIANLLDNAIKYGGESPRIHIKAASGNGQLIVEVTNGGLGIPAEYRDKVFDRFFRVPSGNLHHVRGYGLGLSYARDIVRQHGGELALQSTSLLTNFTIHLPIAIHESAENTVVGR
jgi:two-component system phosphate regulon sensor histidine kinase PhoR